MAETDTGDDKVPPRANRLAPVDPSAEVFPQRSGYLDGGYYGPPQVANVRDLRRELLDYLRIVLKRKMLIIGIAASIFALGATRTLMMTPLYTASVRLQIDRDSVRVIEGGNVTPMEAASAEHLRTQFELLQSRAMAARVVAALKLADDEDILSPAFSLRGFVTKLFRGPAQETGEGDREARERAIAGLVQANVAVRPVTGSRLVDVSYTDRSPARSQKIANAYADAYIASTVDKRFEANAFAKTFLEDQVQQLKIRLEESERALLSFAEEAKIVEITEKSSIAETNLVAANAAIAALIADRIRAEQMWRQVDQSDALTNPQVLTNAVIDGLRARRNGLVTEYREKLDTFKPGYPAMQQIDEKIKEVDRQLASEVKTIRASLRSAYETALNQETEMRKRVDELKADVLELQKSMIKYNSLKRDVDTNRSLYNNLLQRYKEVDVASGVSATNVFIIDRASMPGAPSSPQFGRAMILSLGLGLGLGLGAALLLERLDDRIHSPADLERVAALPTLGIIPTVDADSSIEAELENPNSAASEAYRSLATALQFSTERGLPKSLAVTSAGPSEGKSITALATARHFARMGLKVLLIDADLRNPSLHKKLGHFDNSFGLSNYLTGACAPQETFQATDVANLAFMPSGPLPPNAADLLAGTRLHSLLSTGLQIFDLIIIDGPPVMGLADAVLLASSAEATIFIAGAGQARAATASTSLRRLQMSRAPVTGTVLTKFNVRNAGYGYGYGYGYGSGYGYGYGQSVKDSSKTASLPPREPGDA